MDVCPECGRPVYEVHPRKVYEDIGELQTLKRVHDPCEIEGDGDEKLLIIHD